RTGPSPRREASGQPSPLLRAFAAAATALLEVGTEPAPATAVAAADRARGQVRHETTGRAQQPRVVRAHLVDAVPRRVADTAHLDLPCGAVRRAHRHRVHQSATVLPAVFSAATISADSAASVPGATATN